MHCKHGTIYEKQKQDEKYRYVQMHNIYSQIHYHYLKTPKYRKKNSAEF